MGTISACRVSVCLGCTLFTESEPPKSFIKTGHLEIQLINFDKLPSSSLPCGCVTNACGGLFEFEQMKNELSV